jgi:hypothetical protein
LTGARSAMHNAERDAERIGVPPFAHGPGPGKYGYRVTRFVSYRKGFYACASKRLSMTSSSIAAMFGSCGPSEAPPHRIAASLREASPAT